MSTKSLWGNLDDLDLVRTPVSVLREQAQILTERTNGQLVGFVESNHAQNPSEFVHFLVVKVPTLNNYEYVILQVTHKIDLYPVNVSSNGSSEILASSCPDEESYVKAVEEILSSPNTKRILSRLLSQIS